jgi:hypothetical protein
VKVSLAFGGHGDFHQTGHDAPGPVAGGPQLLQKLIAGEFLPLKFVQALPVDFEFASAYGAFLVGAGATFGQHVDFAVLRQQFHAQLRAHFLPGLLRQLLFQFGQLALGRAHEVAHLGLALPQLGQHGFGRDAAIHHPDALGAAVTFLDTLEHVPQRGLVGGVAGQHLVGQRQALGRDHQGHDHLHAVGAFVPAVTEAAGISFIPGHVTLEIRAGQVVKQHVELCTEEITPALAQMGEEGVLVFEQSVEAAIERIVLGMAFVHTQEIRQCRGAKPVPVQTPFTAGGEQTVKRQEAQHLFPICALATASEAWSEEGVELKLAPELIAQPAVAPGAGTGELQLIQSHLHGGRVAGVRRAILGKECALVGLPLLFIEDRDGLLPGGALRIVDLAQIENVTLDDCVSEAATLDDGPGAMLLAVLLSGAALEKHETSVAETGREGRDRVATTRAFVTSIAELLRKITRPTPEKSQKTIQ